ncbi:MAG: signal peptide peptidase SppA [Gammaproteobacteria bacterium]|nr:signal peptide peptidase SppA [Gammaproteobacteria bacterium]
MSDENKPQDPWLGEAQAPRAGAGKGAGDETWARGVLEKLVQSTLKEQRSARRWGIFFKLAFLGYLLLILYTYWPGQFVDENLAGRHTALIDIDGVIADDRDASADYIIDSLREAFENKNAAAIVLRINSPGGSPVQAGYINDEIARLRVQHPDKKVYAVITDICASGGYYIAAGADEIYADKASIVGSIGVLMDGFGFVNTLDKLGVERRLITAGDHKGFLDPFSPLKPDDEQHIRAMLAEIHQQFIDTVKKGRGNRLKDDPSLFSGLVWTGEDSLKLGLIDGLGSTSYVAREVIGAEEIVDYTYQPPYFQRFAERIGAAAAEGLEGIFKVELK